MSRNWVLPLAMAMGVALLAAPAAHAGAGYFTSQDLTSSIGAPIGDEEAAGWSTPWDLQRHFAYYSRDNRLIVASSAPGGAWTWTTAATSAWYDASFSTYSYSWDHSSHIVYVDGSTRHLMEVWSSEASPAWQTTDLTATYNGPLLATSPHGYEQDGQQHIVFTDANEDGTLWEAVFAPATGWRFTNVTALSGIRGQSKGDVTASSIGLDGEAIGYINPDGYPHVLIGKGGQWTDQRVGLPESTQYPGLHSMSFLRDGHLARYSLRYVSGISLREVSWTPGGWTDTGLVDVLGTAVYPVQNNDSFIFDADGSEHMFAAVFGGPVKEVVRTRDGRWFLWTDTAPIVDSAVWVSAFAAPDDTVHGTETEFYIYLDGNRHVVVSDLTAPYQP